MKRFYQLLISTVAVSSLFAACSSNEEEVILDDKQPREVILDMTIQTDIENPQPLSRASQVSNDHRVEYLEAPDRSFEYVSTLRVIILHENTDNSTNENAKYAVEEMRLVNTNDAGVPISDNLSFRLLANEWKHIIIIGNEASLTLPTLASGESASSVSEFLNKYFAIGNVISNDLHERLENWTVNLPQPVNGVTPNIFYVDENSRIPLTESFDIKTIEPKAGSVATQSDNIQRVQFFVSRLAAKISYTFQSSADSKSQWIDGEVLGVRLRYLDEKMYVMAHNVRYYPTKYLTKVINGVTTNIPDTGNINPSTRTRYITGLSVPPLNMYRTITTMFDKPVKIKHYDNPDSIPVVGPIYFTESMARKSGDHFEIDVQVRKNGVTKWLGYKSMTSNILSFIPTYNQDDLEDLGYFNAIARNSHTKVTVSFGGSDFRVYENVVPYVGVNLKPIFGTDVETPAPEN